MVAKIWCGDLAQLLDVFICHFAVPFNAFLRMSFHITGPPNSVCTTFLRNRSLFSRSCRDSRFASSTTFLGSVYLHVECIPSTLYTHSVSHAHCSDTFSLRGVQISITRMAQGGCGAHVISLHLTLSILMFHPPSLLFPDGHFETTFPTLTSAPSLPNCSRSESVDQAHFRTSGGEFGYLADPTHSTGYEPKDIDKITSADGDTTPINDPNYDDVFDFAKITRENTGLFGVSTMSEASVLHVSPGESKDSMHRETVARQRERRTRRFCDQRCRVDVKEKSTEQYQESLSSDSQRILF